MPTEMYYPTVKYIGCLSHLTALLEAQTKLQVSESDSCREILTDIRIQQWRLTKLFMHLLFYEVFSIHHSCSHQDLAGFRPAVSSGRNSSQNLKHEVPLTKPLCKGEF